MRGRGEHGTRRETRVAFCEASGPCLIRVESNDDELRQAAIANAKALGAGHVLVLFRFPANLTQQRRLN